MDSASLAPRSPVFLAPQGEARDYLPLLRWLVLMSLIGFGVAILGRIGLFQVMFATDRTHISSLILALFALTSLHCLTQTWGISQELVAARALRDKLTEDPGALSLLLADPARLPRESVIGRHIGNLLAKARAQRGRRIDQTLLLRALSERLRGREKLGLFVSESLLRLALLGTAVGFILMLIPIAGLRAFDAETLRKALAGMSGGMATALNITVTGIATALLLKLQYFFLDQAVTDLYHKITDFTEVHIVSALEHGGDV